MKLKLYFTTVAIITLSFITNAQVSEKEDEARKWIKDNESRLDINPNDTFSLRFVRKTQAGETLRFQQMINEVPVYQSEIVVNFNPSNELVFTSDSYKSMQVFSDRISIASIKFEFEKNNLEILEAVKQRVVPRVPVTRGPAQGDGCGIPGDQ